MFEERIGKCLFEVEFWGCVGRSKGCVRLDEIEERFGISVREICKVFVVVYVIEFFFFFREVFRNFILCIVVFG